MSMSWFSGPDSAGSALPIAWPGLGAPCWCSNQRPAGWMRPNRTTTAGFWFEMGTHTLYNSYGSLLAIIDDLGLRDSMLTRKRAPFRLLVEGKLRSIPSQLSLAELFASAWHAFSECKQGQTVADYYGKLVGRHNWKRVFAPLFAAVPSQPVDNFPAEILFKSAPAAKTSHAASPLPVESRP